MLASLLPGLRDLRAPVVTGYIWLIVLWLLLEDHVPRPSEARGALQSLYELAQDRVDGGVPASDHRDHRVGVHSWSLELLCCVCVPFRPAARTAWATDLPAVFHLPHSRCGSLVTQPRS
jgi:hypothetical protein